jgi:hypothetical protein
MSAPVTPLRLQPPATHLDALALDAALGRAYHELAGHWLHAFRGSLNGLSLNLLVLTSTHSEAASRLAASSMRTQLRELDVALSHGLDHSVVNDASDGQCELVPLLERVRALVDPLAHSRHAVVELVSTVRRSRCQADAWVLHAVLVPTLVDILAGAHKGSALTLLVEDDPSGDLRLDVTPADAAPGTLFDAGLRAAARRALQSLGGDVPEVPGCPDALRLILRRPTSESSDERASHTA